jgi:hypothetical protein
MIIEETIAIMVNPLLAIAFTTHSWSALRPVFPASGSLASPVQLIALIAALAASKV